MAMSKVPPYWMVICPKCGREQEVSVREVKVETEGQAMYVEAKAGAFHECVL